MCRLASTIWNLRDAASYDVIMMNRDLVPETMICFLEPWLVKRNPKVIFDFDDSIHLGTREKKLRRILPLFAWITPGNAYLAEFARKVHTQVTVWPTVVNTDYYKPVAARKPGPVRIGWSGSNSTAQNCLPLLEKPICDLARSEQFEFVVISNSDPHINWKGVQTRYIPWNADTEVEGLQELDLGLMPLHDEPFERGKCGLKAIQYMGVGLPALVSPVGVNRQIVSNGETGFHCSIDTDWVSRIRSVISDDRVRMQLGAAARARVVTTYSVQCLLPRMLETFEKVALVGRPR